MCSISNTAHPKSKSGRVVKHAQTISRLTGSNSYGSRYLTIKRNIPSLESLLFLYTVCYIWVSIYIEDAMPALFGGFNALHNLEHSMNYGMIFAAVSYLVNTVEVALLLGRRGNIGIGTVE